MNRDQLEAIESTSIAQLASCKLILQSNPDDVWTQQYVIDTESVLDWARRELAALAGDAPQPQPLANNEINFWE